MKIAFVASEMRPFAKTGGLGDSVGGLAEALAAAGHTVKVFLPLYKSVSNTSLPLQKIADDLRVPVGQGLEHGRLFKTRYGKLEVFFIDQHFFFGRQGLYGDFRGDYDDNDIRYTFFARGAMEAMRRLEFSPDILHGHDWHAGLVPAYLRFIYRQTELFRSTRSVFTIHNIAYQGNFHIDSFQLTGLPWEACSPEGLEFWGDINFLKSGIVYADRLLTVSQEFAREIQDEPFGRGLEGAIRSRSGELVGILNGIDAKWPTSGRGYLPARVSDELFKLKAKAKKTIQKELGLALNAQVPLVSFIGRLSAQKGLDLILPVLPRLKDLAAQFVFLGVGSSYYEEKLKEIAAKDPRFKVCFVFDEDLASRLYEASDIFLMPSVFEPCGIGQMLAMRSAAVPVVHATGGLKETVEDFDLTTQKGTGVVFHEATSEAFWLALNRALQLFGQKEIWRGLMANCLKKDFSWARQAKLYLDVYNALCPDAPSSNTDSTEGLDKGVAPKRRAAADKKIRRKRK